MENDVGIVNYTPELLKKIASQNDVEVELNYHGGKIISKVDKLYYDDGKLNAIVDIPDEYIVPNVDIGWSTDIIPTTYISNGTKNDLVDGYLDKIVFLSDLNNTFQPNDKNTISRLLNTTNKKYEDDNMTNDDISRLYGQLQEENRSLKEEIEALKIDNGKLTKKVEKQDKDYTKLKEDYEVGEALYNKGKVQYEETLKVANEYKEMKEAKKQELLEKLVPKDDKGVQDEFKLGMYSKLEINELESLINDKPKAPSTPPKGATGDGMGIVDNGQNNNDADESTIYLEAKKAFNL